LQTSSCNFDAFDDELSTGIFSKNQTSTFVGKVKKSQVHTARSGNLRQSLAAVDLLDTPADFTSTEKILKFQMKNSLGSLVWSARSMQRYFTISFGR